MSLSEAAYIIAAAVCIVGAIVLTFLKQYDLARWAIVMWALSSIKADMAMFKGAVKIVIEEEGEK